MYGDLRESSLEKNWKKNLRFNERRRKNIKIIKYASI